MIKRLLMPLVLIITITIGFSGNIISGAAALCINRLFSQNSNAISEAAVRPVEAGREEHISRRADITQDAAAVVLQENGTPAPESLYAVQEDSGQEDSSYIIYIGSDFQSYTDAKIPPKAVPVYEYIYHEAVYDTVYHEGEWVTVHHDAEYETVHHDAVYETIIHDAEYEIVHHEEETTVIHHDAGWARVYVEAHWETVHHDAVYEEVIHPAEVETHYICNGCGHDYGTQIPTYEEAMAHMASDGGGFHSVQVIINDYWVEYVLLEEAYDEEVYHEAGWEYYYCPEPWDEIQTTPAWDEQVLISEEWTETVLVSEAWDEEVLVTEAWDEEVWQEPWTEEVLITPEWTEEVLTGYEYIQPEFEFDPPVIIDWGAV